MSSPRLSTWPRAVIISAVFIAPAVLPAASLAQPTPPAATQSNPRAGDAEAVDEGKYLFKGRCAVCHGMDAKGYRGTDLTTDDWVHGGGDAQIFRSISRGIPGTEMPAANMREDEIWAVVAYLRTLASPASAGEMRGDATRGEELFWSRAKGNCGQCHMVQGKGGRLGPALSRIGASRSIGALEREIRRPAEVVPVGFETVTLVKPDGTKLRGARKNEDTFSVQVMTFDEQVHSFFKRDLKEVIEEKESLMPAYGPERLTPAELDDVIRYLKTLRGSSQASNP